MNALQEQARRTETVSVKVSPEEQQALRVAAAKRNMSIGRYIRTLVLQRAQREAAA